MIQAVLFDLDGVLVSTDELHFKAWERLAKDLSITTFTREDNARQRGVSRLESLEVVLEKSGQSYTAEEKLALAEKKNAYYVEMLQTVDETYILKNAKETVLHLKEKGIRIAVGSVSKNAPFILERTGLLPLCDAVASGHDTARSKPDPEVFLVAAQKAGILPEHCLVVEDADAGVEAGHAGGMLTLGIGPARRHPLADFRAQSLADDTLDWERILRGR
ncbi:MAG TPA: beta-phosphoglucomutase [Feifaniaceae bacterium]|nr:beta-phosphoglucomutase [Feifaniaceae bacterium]